MIVSQIRCPRCDAAIPEEAPAGQCIQCALSLVLDPEPPGAEPGQWRLGPYLLLEQLGEGATGVVWKARHERLNKLVALKQLKSGFLATPAELDRFRAEMEVVASLDHPHIVPVFDAGEDHGHAWCAMRLLEGGTLADRISDRVPAPGGPDSDARHAMDPESAARLVATLARAIHHAHQLGIIHRDLKPSNVLLDREGQPHVADFGLAKRLGADTGRTITGAILGTVHYLAPEQAAGDSKRLTTAVDVYALGVILYELLAGRPPFTGPTIPGVLRLISEADPVPPLDRLRPPVGATVAAGDSRLQRTRAGRARLSDLNLVCLKCLAKDPARRYASAVAMAEDLDRWLRREPILARPPTRWERATQVVRRHPVRVALAGVVLLALIMAGTFAYASQRTYYWLMAKINDQHLVVPPEDDGVFRLHLKREEPPRCTYNFWKEPFGNYYKNPTRGRFARLEFAGVPPEFARTLQVRVWSDVPGYPDIPRTPMLTHGSIFHLDKGQRRERAYYIGGENFKGRKVLEQFPDAAVHIILLGRPGDADPHKPAGRLLPEERR